MRNTCLTIVVLALVSPSLICQTAHTQPVGDPTRIAQEITVAIDGDNRGSAAIVKHQGSTYTILTNWHVLKQRSNFSVRTHDGKTYPLVVGSIQKVGSNLDLAVAQFVSPNFYRTAVLRSSDMVKVGDAVFVAGAPADLEGITTRSVLIVPGNVVGMEARPEEGYSLIYNNNTMPGMSGGAVVDGQGYLVGIHGRGARDNRSQKAGFNLGIPMSALSPTLMNTVGMARQVNSSRTVLNPAPSYPTNSIAPTNNSIVPTRPRTVDGSEGADGTCAGSHC
jgi:serine protease Do